MAEQENNFGEKLGAILNNPQAMEQIMAIARSLGGATETQSPPSSAPNPSQPPPFSSPNPTQFPPSPNLNPAQFPPLPDPNSTQITTDFGPNSPSNGSSFGSNSGGGGFGPNSGEGGFGSNSGGGGFGPNSSAGGVGSNSGGGGFGSNSGGGGFGSNSSAGGGGVGSNSAQGSSPASAPFSPALDSGFSGVDPKLMAAAMRALEAYRDPHNRQAALLGALKPFLKPQRQAKVEKAVQIAKLSKMVRSALEGWKGGEGGV